MFGPPLGFFVAAHAMGSIIARQNAMGASSLGSLATTGAHALVTLADLATLMWFGMWMGLVSKNANAATWKTLLFVQVIPWFALSVATALIIFLVAIPKFRASTALMQFINTAIPVAGSLGIDWALFVFARRRLFSELRQRAAAA
jgi:hypothetical protein